MEITPSNIIILVGFGLIASAFFAQSVRLSLASRRWKRVAATVVTAYTKETVARGKEGRTYHRYHAILEYRYSFDGKSYTSKAVRADGTGLGMYNSRHQAEAHAAHYQAGNSLMVAVNPDNPTQACLETGITFDMVRKNNAFQIAVVLYLIAAFFTVVLIAER